MEIYELELVSLTLHILMNVSMPLEMHAYVIYRVDYILAFALIIGSSKLICHSESLSFIDMCICNPVHLLQQ